MGDMGEYFKDWSAHKRETRDERKEACAKLVAELVEEGFTVTTFSDSHYRFNGVFDIYCAGCKWHDLRTQERGRFSVDGLKDFVRVKLGTEV